MTDLDIYEGSVVISDLMFGRGDPNRKYRIKLPKKNGDPYHDSLIGWIRSHRKDAPNVEVVEDDGPAGSSG